MQKQCFQIEGYETRTKRVSPAGSSGRVFLPKKWVGKEVTIVLNELIDEQKGKGV
jgi:phage terminase large subunit-like protein